MDTLWQDLRYAARMLINKPGFTAVVVSTLALGIGANTAIFSLVDAVLLRPLPFKEPERLVRVYETFPNVKYTSVAYRSYVEWRGRNRSFEQLGAAFPFEYNLEMTGEPERISGALVSANFFDTLGVTPMLGRVFSPEECLAGHEHVVILSHGLWQRRFGGDPRVLGQTVRIHGNPKTIVGVMPPLPTYPVIEWQEMWTPLYVSNEAEELESKRRWLGVIGRLKPGVTPEAAQAEVTALQRQLAQESPNTHSNYGAYLRPLHEVVVGQIQSALAILLGAVGFVLLIACANVANLLLARATAREKEIAVRIALGAGRLRLIQQLLTESLILSLLGAALGLVFAYGGLSLIRAFNFGNIPRLNEVKMDGQVLVFTLIAALLTSLIFGLFPALAASKPTLNEVLKESGRGSSSGLQSRMIRSLLVVAEVALALVLLICSGLTLKSFLRMMQVDAGFRPEKALTFEVILPFKKYKEAPQRAEFCRQALERLTKLPGVEAAGVINVLPLRGASNTTVFIEGDGLPPPGSEPLSSSRVVSPDYFRALDIPLITGRTFTPQEAWEKGGVVLINQAMARRFWPKADPLGKRLKHTRDGDWLVVIGVVGDVRQRGLSEPAQPETYLSPASSSGNSRVTFVLRARNDAANLIAPAREQMRELDPAQPLSNMLTMQHVVDDSIAQPRFSMMLLSLFAALALALAAVGIYGVLAYTVNQRTKEIGIRLALGAQTGDVIRMVLRSGMKLVLMGMVIGLLIALALTRVMANLLYGMNSLDPMIYLAAPLTLAAVAAMACYLPARRAANVDPMIALRAE